MDRIFGLGPNDRGSNPLRLILKINEIPRRAKK